MQWRFLLLFLFASLQPVSALVHPGAQHTAVDLQLIRSRLAAGAEPWKSAWAALERSGPAATYRANVTPTITDEYPMQVQGHAAYVLALKWVASGDMAYATACKNLINAWVNTVTRVASHQAPLRFGTGGNQMANAAEIMAHGFNGSAGWPAAEVARAKAWFETVIYPTLRRGASSNHGTSCLSGAMGVAIFCDNQAMFDYAVEVYKNGYLGSCNISVKDYIFLPNGQSVESGRDAAHVQFGIANLVNVARMAWVQGVNIVTYENNRLVAGMEYAAKYGLGEFVPYNANFPDACNIHPNWPVISTLQRGHWYPVWEVSARLFTDAGIPHPYTARVLNSSGYINKPAGVGTYRPERSMDDAGGHGTLMYAGGSTPNGTSIILIDRSADAVSRPMLRLEQGRMILSGWNGNEGPQRGFFGLNGRVDR